MANNAFVENNVYQGAAAACITDLTPPTFAGIVSLTSLSIGQLRATWASATDSSTPVHYELYIQKDTATGLFSLSNIALITNNLTIDVFQLSNGDFLSQGDTYFVGIRAVDAIGNRDTNLVSLSAVSEGVAEGSSKYACDGAFSFNTSNQLTGSLWLNVDEELRSSGLGTASYEIYDKTGTLVPSMTQSGIAANGQGQFIITPVANTLNQSLDHYLVKISIVCDSATRVRYVPLVQKIPSYKCHGVFSLSSSNQFQGTLWASADGITKTSGLGTASYTVYDASGAAVAGMTQSGISADGNGRFIITPIASSLVDLTHYTIRVAITVDGILRTSYVGLTLGI